MCVYVYTCVCLCCVVFVCCLFVVVVFYVKGYKFCFPPRARYKKPHTRSNECGSSGCPVRSHLQCTAPRARHQRCCIQGNSQPCQHADQPSWRSLCAHQRRCRQREDNNDNIVFIIITIAITVIAQQRQQRCAGGEERVLWHSAERCSTHWQLSWRSGELGCAAGALQDCVVQCRW